jgi:putative heme-binding domain-containing protein
LNSGGTLALRPDTLELGVTMKGLVNGWGHVWDDFGQEFQTDGAGGAGINWNIPQAMFLTYEGARRIIGSVSPGAYPKFCGLELIKSERFPKEWQGNAVTCDFRANRVVRFEILEQGAAYTTKQHEFLRSTNITFRPIDVKVGPDGAIYIADWSNPIIQHGEVDFRDPRRDRVHGRIWRVAHKTGNDLKKPNVQRASNTELLNRLNSVNGFEAEKASRLLIERGAEEVSKDLASWTKKQSDEAALLRALWMHQALDIVEPKLLGRLLEAKDGRVRAAATRVLAWWAGNTPGIPSLAKTRIDSSTALDLLEKRIADEHPRVRVEALRALGRIPTARSTELALSVLEKGQVEGFLEYALWLTINDLAEPWAAALESGAWKIEGREKQLQYALKSIEPKLATRLMARVIGDKPLPRDGSGGMIELIGQAGGPPQLRQLFDQALGGGFNDDATARALNWLGEAARLRNAKPSSDLNAVTKLLDAGGDNVRAAAAKLAGSWKLTSVAPTLSKTASDANAAAPLRQASIEGLRDLGGREAIASLRALTKDGNQSIRRSSAAALAATDLNGSMPQILEVVSATSNEDDALALWRSLLTAKGSSAAFTKALGTANLPEPVARAGLRAAREGGRNEPNLVLALNKAGGISDASAALTDNEIHAIAYEVTKGNPVNGEKIYRNKQLGCVLCHAIGGAGGKVGPDMTSLGASTPVADYLVESVLLPNKRVKEGYNSVQITTKDGEDIAGNLVREDNEQVILRDATAKEVSVSKRSIASRKMGGSLMPSGLLDFITPQERLDLYAFLAQLGKPGPYDATKQNVARVWRLNGKVGTVNADEMLKADVRTGKDWAPLYTTVAGSLPKADVLEELGANVGTFWAASRFQTTKTGPVRFAIHGTASPKVWIDGKPVGGDKDLTVDLPAGAHTFFIKVTASDLSGPLRVESNDATFLVD